MPSPQTPAVLTERVDLELSLQQPSQLGATGIEVTLLKGSQDRIQLDDGRIVDQTSGRVKLVRGGEVIEVDFVSGQAFEAFGHPMAVFGPAGWLELSAFPPGAAVRP